MKERVMSNPHPSPSHRLRRRWMLLVSGLFLVLGVLGGCGQEITFSGPECTQDLRLLADEGDQRLGCIVFAHDTVARAVVYRQRSGYWQMFYCATTDRQTCDIAITSVRAGKDKNADETAVIAFPPRDESDQFGDATSFLEFCASRFDPDRPASPTCQNDGSQTSPSEIKQCWFVFHFTFKRSQQTGQCIRWVRPF